MLIITFDPYTTEEIQESGSSLLKVGICNFEVVDVTFGPSKNSGKDQFTLVLKVWDENGKSAVIYDYIPLELRWKLLQLAKCLGFVKKLQEGKLTTDDIYRECGKLKNGIKKSTDPQYFDKNIVASYLPMEPMEPKEERIDDDLPF